MKIKPKMLLDFKNGCLSVGVKVEEDLMDPPPFCKSAEGGRKKRQKGINTAEWAAGSGPSPDRYKLNLSSERKGVRVCVQKRGKGSSLSVQGKQEGFTSTGAAFVREAQGNDMEEGGVTIRALLALER